MRPYRSQFWALISGVLVQSKYFYTHASWSWIGRSLSLNALWLAATSSVPLIYTPKQLRDHSWPVRPKRPQRYTFLGVGGGKRGRRGSGVRDMALPSLGYLEAKFSETSFPDFKTYFTQISCCYHFYPIIVHSQQHLVLLNWAENNHVVGYDFPV